MTHRNYWHSSDVKPEGRRPEELCANNCGVARGLAYVITNLWYELTCLHGYRDVNLRLNNFRSELLRLSYLKAFWKKRRIAL